MSAKASSGQTLTTEQEAALTLRGMSLALSAGAGCGKTFILTERFLADLETRDDPQTLYRRVAITFTERAAREMRDRIRSASRRRLEACAADRIDYWQGILHGLDTARISTIHSFCASILRTHAVETRLDPQFGLLDRQTTSTFLFKTASQTVRSRLIAQDPAMMDLVLHYGLEKTTGLLVSLVAQRYRGDWKTFADLTPELLQAKWIENYHRTFVPQVLAAFVTSPLVANLLETLRLNEPTHNVMKERRAWLLIHLPELTQAEDPFDFLDQIKQQAKVQGGGTKNHWPSVEIYESIRDGLTSLRNEIDDLKKMLNLDNGVTERAARLSLAAVHAATAADADFAAMKAQQGLLDFDDLLIKTRDLLVEHPEVRRRLQNGIELLMVDEFQDTDPLQAEIVKWLCGEQLLDGKLFLVGDVKQSIYRFRRAEPRLFREFRENMHSPGRLLLSMNFRSQPAILNFVNAVFGKAIDEYDLLRPFSDKQLSPPPGIEFLFAHASDEPSAEEAKSEEDAEVVDDQNADPENADRLRAREAEWIAKRICELLDDPTPRVRERDPVSGETRLRRVQPGDIVLLFRGLTNVAVYEEALRSCGLDYYLVGGRAFYAQQEIYDIVNLLSYVDDPDDVVSLVGALRSPFFSLSDDTLLAIARQENGWTSFATQPVPDGLPDDQSAQLARAKAVCCQLASAKDRLSFVELMQLMLELTGFDASLLHEFLGKRKLANLRKLIELARSFDQAGVFTLKDFVQRLRTAVEDETDEEFAALHAEKTEIIRLMTIHQSKGLEFPVVFVVQMQWKPQAGRSGVYFHPEFGALLPSTTQVGEFEKSIAQHMHAHREKQEDADEVVRLLYVAMTRAADHLVLSGGFKLQPEFEERLSPWMSLLRERFDLSTGLPKFDALLGTNLGDASAAAIPEIKVHLAVPNEPETRDDESSWSKPKHFASTVDLAEPAAFPPLYGTIPLAVDALTEFSVSAIEAAFDGLHPAEAEMAAHRQAAAMVDVDLVDDEPSLPATELGTAMHLALEWVDFASDEPLAALVERVFATKIPPPSADIAHAVVRRLEVLQSSALWTELRHARQCWRELDFLLSWPIDRDENRSTSTVIRGTIDCLYDSADGELVVRDYKTTPWNRAADARGLDKYAIQLGLYALAVEQLFGRLPERVELVFLGRQATRLAMTPNEQSLTDVKRRVDAVVEFLSDPRRRVLSESLQ